MSVPYFDGEVIEVRDVLDGRHRLFVVRDEEVEWFAVVEFFPLHTSGARLTCWCSEGQQIAADRRDGEDTRDRSCKHLDAVTDYLAPPPPARPVVPVNVAAFVD